MGSENLFKNNNTDKVNSSRFLKVGTKSDTVDLAEGASRAFMTDIDGIVKVVGAGESGATENPVVITVKAGIVYPIALRQVYVTGSTASIVVTLLV